MNIIRAVFITFLDALLITQYAGFVCFSAALIVIDHLDSHQVQQVKYSLIVAAVSYFILCFVCVVHFLMRDWKDESERLYWQEGLGGIFRFAGPRKRGVYAFMVILYYLLVVRRSFGREFFGTDMLNRIDAVMPRWIMDVAWFFSRYMLHIFLLVAGLFLIAFYSGSAAVDELVFPALKGVFSVFFIYALLGPPYSYLVVNRMIMKEEGEYSLFQLDDYYRKVYRRDK